MKSEQPKVLFPVCGVPMVQYVLWEAVKLSPLPPLVVVGYGGEQVIAALGDQADYVWQKEQLGTGDAVKKPVSIWRSLKAIFWCSTEILPLFRPRVCKRWWIPTGALKAAATVLTAELQDPTGYGRIVRSPEGLLTEIVEEKDASADEKRFERSILGSIVFPCRNCGLLWRL